MFLNLVIDGRAGAGRIEKRSRVEAGKHGEWALGRGGLPCLLEETIDRVCLSSAQSNLYRAATAIVVLLPPSSPPS